VLLGYRNGIVRSTSLMVYGASARSAADIALEEPALSVGIHLDLGEWRFTDGRWEAIYERAPLDDEKELEHEVSAQLEAYHELMGGAPTHIDSHQHAHRNEPLRTIVLAKGAELGIPVRHFSPGIRYCGDFYGQDEQGRPFHDRLSAEFLAELVRSLPEGTTELCCHPADVVDFEGVYSAERLVELASLCDPLVTSAVDAAGVALVGFGSATEDPAQ
jgi:predicted glycoside hydrolase/deacetylase ChbG (UPF0249 family)